ncbi:Sphingosine-1-phosphate phosphatase [Schizosaccharomyces pombe]|uniref:Dihydrosphingosine 1-phosphate phosphatase C823.11 n=1 Tax=Schizosaccharomyces pombe (strain 972 / ATCC 24843) TaxID=284812 RepID=DS1PP_SCHPO|nr:putative sphingosine-1-phosphate phosphatase [Schizosaccharomyces pombe]Q9P6N5.1 RecName: Full=Dihydrosphingosine 1-phosphate phosphatase C823.11 [Schizosaccharomyces pombe 972h-]CAB90156.1 sphingosine-1-phosphate phosphatase (predicted) [Schizosaccharomyces pombe]|eukprot:NP_593838.1 putative sphingosine-1-phosphate phosphatase [Schizosaccharomyces pombe]
MVHKKKNVDIPSSQKYLGIQHVNFYSNAFGKESLRFQLRELILPIVRKETRLLYKIQSFFRNPWLDVYFMYTATLGTHVFFMLALPIFFWSGCIYYTLDITQLFAAGVYFSGCIKDYFCLPRPRSPPMVRLTLSSDAEYEYGFPSTHTTNAMATGFYSLFLLLSMSDSMSSISYYFLLSLVLLYIASISLGRIYCGMHGFMDVSTGTILGVTLAIFQWKYADFFHNVWSSSSTSVPILSVVLALFFIWFHPQPAERCICLEDSISFISVIMGIDLGTWFASPESLSHLHDNLNSYFLLKFFVRVLFGVCMILIWKSFAKQALLAVLPPIFKSLRLSYLEPKSQSEKGIRAATGSNHSPGNIGTELGVITSHQSHPHPVRFDIETIARIIVYSGIGFLCTYFAPKVFLKWKI